MSSIMSEAMPEASGNENPRNLAPQLFANGGGEPLIILAMHDKGARAANHLGGVMRHQVRFFVQHRQGIDGDAGLHTNIADRPWWPALIMRAIAGNIQDHPPCFTWAAGK